MANNISNSEPLVKSFYKTIGKKNVRFETEEGKVFFRRGNETYRKSDVAAKSKMKLEKRMARIEERRAAKAERSQETQTGQNLDMTV